MRCFLQQTLSAFKIISRTGWKLAFYSDKHSGLCTRIVGHWALDGHWWTVEAVDEMDTFNLPTVPPSPNKCVETSDPTIFVF